MTDDLSEWPEELREAEAARRCAMCDADVGSLDDILHEELIYIHSTGRCDGKAAQLDSIGSGAVRYGRLCSSRVKSVKLSTDIWLLTGRLTGQVFAGGGTFEIDAAFTCVWVREVRWRLMSWQSTAWPGVD